MNCRFCQRKLQFVEIFKASFQNIVQMPEHDTRWLATCILPFENLLWACDSRPFVMFLLSHISKSSARAWAFGGNWTKKKGKKLSQAEREGESDSFESRQLDSQDSFAMNLCIMCHLFFQSKKSAASRNVKFRFQLYRDSG